MFRRQRIRSGKVALFIDVPNQCGVDIEWVMNAARARGEVEMAWGYGDFFRRNGPLRPVVGRLREAGVRLIHCPATKAAHRDMTDLFMMRDIYHFLVQRPDIDCFVVCTGDGGFTDTVATIRAHGRQAVVIGPPNATSRKLAREANQCLISPLSVPDRKQSRPISRASARNKVHRRNDKLRQPMANLPPLEKPGKAFPSQEAAGHN